MSTLLLLLSSHYELSLLRDFQFSTTFTSERFSWKVMQWNDFCPIRLGRISVPRASTLTLPSYPLMNEWSSTRLLFRMLLQGRLPPITLDCRIEYNCCCCCCYLIGMLPFAFKEEESDLVLSIELFPSSVFTYIFTPRFLDFPLCWLSPS